MYMVKGLQVLRKVAIALFILTIGGGLLDFFSESTSFPDVYTLIPLCILIIVLLVMLVMWIFDTMIQKQ